MRAVATVFQVRTSLHCTVNAVHDGKIEPFVVDLQASIAEGRAAAASSELGAYGTVE